MLYMSIYTWKPEKRDEIIKRRAEKGELIPPGVKVHGEWVDISGGRVFRLTESDDPGASFKAALAWTDVGELEITPVMTTEDTLKIIAGG